MVVAAMEGNAMRVMTLDRTARRLGLAVHLPLADARARIPDLRVVAQDRAADIQLLGHIADWCERYTPVVCEDGEDGLILEVWGSAHLFAGEDRLLSDMQTRLTAMGFSSRAAIAGTAACARALARFGKGRIIPTGQEEKAVADLPVAALELDLPRMTTLRRAGLKTIGDLARCPSRPLTARFGADMMERLAGILGRSDCSITARRPPPFLESTESFAEPIGLVGDIAMVLDRLSLDLCLRLERHGLGGRAFEAVFFRADGQVRRIAAMTGQPLRDPGALKSLFLTRLDALADPVDPGFGFDMIKLVVLREEKAAPQQWKLDRTHDDTQPLDDLIDRLSARFGPDVVECFEARESHIPERAVKRFAAIRSPAVAWTWRALSPGEPPLRPLLLFSPPQLVETVAEVPDGPPFRFRWRRVLHEISRAEGPERLSVEWWRESADAMTRDYYRVEDTQGRRFWLFRHGIYGRETTSPSWYVHGLFS